jgi:hypothetical protein
MCSECGEYIEDCECDDEEPEKEKDPYRPPMVGDPPLLYRYTKFAVKQQVLYQYAMEQSMLARGMIPGHMKQGLWPHLVV